jgi:hypothetical protein
MRHHFCHPQAMWYYYLAGNCKGTMDITHEWCPKITSGEATSDFGTTAQVCNIHGFRASWTVITLLFFDTGNFGFFFKNLEIFHYDTIVLFICKTKSRLRRRHCGLARPFKTDPTETVALCFGYTKTLF